MRADGIFGARSAAVLGTAARGAHSVSLCLPSRLPRPKVIGGSSLLPLGLGEEVRRGPRREEADGAAGAARSQEPHGTSAVRGTAMGP